jgi:DNA modification methylase
MAGILYWADNLVVMRTKVADASVDLAYLDPPFGAGRVMRSYAGTFQDSWSWASPAYEALLTEAPRPVANLVRGLYEAFGASPLVGYLVDIIPRLIEVERVLKGTGTLYLHCDPTAAHYLKLALDALLLPRGGVFLNEVLWCYGVGRRPKDAYGRKHDTILVYTKSATHTFNADGANIPKKKTNAKRGVDEEGRAYTEKTARTGKTYRYFEDEGKIAEDWWTDIEILNGEAKERTGYPTQKPEALLERIIRTSSNPGDVVLEPWAGSGTASAVAEREGRDWIAIDDSHDAVNVILKRMKGAKVVLDGA